MCMSTITHNPIQDINTIIYTYYSPFKLFSKLITFNLPININIDANNTHKKFGILFCKTI